MVKNFKGPYEILCDGVKTVSKFSYLGDKLMQLVVAKERKQLEQELVG